jgi:arginyl-tRNA synthetase
MFHLLEKRIAQAFASRVESLYGARAAVQAEQPKQASFGEIAIPVAFQLARQLKKAPKAIAAELAGAVGRIDGVSAIEIAGNGYLNVRLDRGAYGSALVQGPPPAVEAVAEKTIVEHTNINPNKAAHIGHLRNAILGDTFVRMLRATGQRVEVQNYIDNTGVQVADVVVGFMHLEKKSPGEVRALTGNPAVRFDYRCWDLYARVSAYYADHPEAVEWRKHTLHAIERGEGAEAEMAHTVSDAIVHAHLATMWRLGIAYDVLPRESEILHLKFWSTAFELLKQREAIHLETEGKNKGCWVMPSSAFREAAADEESAEDSKVIVRSNGTVTYVGKDIAYQLWKFGLLGKDFHYRAWHTYPDGQVVWASTDDPQPEGAPRFGGGARVYNVIDSRQSYLQDVVVAGLRALGYSPQADASVHFSYEMVALTPATCVELGIELSEEDQQRPYVEVSGRKGLGVKADDLIDRLVARALEEVTSRHGEEPEASRRRAATLIAVGALRYFMLKYTRNSVIAFDLGEALSFEGDTGPYVQYAAVRARRILDKAGALPEFRRALGAAAMARHLAQEDAWQLVLPASKADSAIERAVASGEPAHVARYAFQLAQEFSNFYQKHPVIAEQDPEKRTFLLWLTDYFRAQLERTLGVLGIEVPEYM